MTWDDDHRESSPHTPQEPGPLLYLAIFLAFILVCGVVNLVGGMQPHAIAEDDYPSAYEESYYPNDDAFWEGQRRGDEARRLNHLEDRIAALERSR
jgi:hypothetical protein